ncbi:hypothetical protein D3C71_2058570 [compost metagenome]
MQTHTEINYRITSQWTRLKLLLEAFINGRDVFRWDHTTFNVIDELVTFRI